MKRRSTMDARERILQAGTELISARGIEGINSNVVARASGVGVGTFYSHFADKHALHRAIVLRAFEALRSEVARARDKAETPAQETDPEAVLDAEVRAVVGAHLDFAERHPDLFRVAFGLPAPQPQPGQPVLGFSTRATEERLRALQAEGRLDPGLSPEVGARGFAGMQNAVALWWSSQGQRPSKDEVIATLARMHPARAGRIVQ